MEVKELYAKYRESGGVSTDTRQIAPGSIFFALKGPNFDANSFAHEALEKGAQYAVVDDRRMADERIFAVSDVLSTLQQLARYHRDQLNIPVIGLTGSNGKTTTKELLQCILLTRFRTHATRGNLNNHIGVPLTLLAIPTTAEIAIIEMGANHVGEIAMLSRMANPTHGLITNIGKAHVGTFGGFENVVRGKSELYDYLLKNKGTVFINSGDQILSNMAKRFSAPVFYPAKGDFYHAELKEADPFVVLITDNGQQLTTQLAGGYNFGNIACALCVGKFFGVDPAAANRSVADYTPANMRSQIVKLGSNTIILDAYNANPTSMEAALRNLAAMKSSRRIAILGDMFELGEDAAEEHRHLGELLTELGSVEAYFCGELMAEAMTTFPAGRYFKTRDLLIAELKARSPENAVVLVKASRGMGLEKVTEVFDQGNAIDERLFRFSG